MYLKRSERFVDTYLVTCRWSWRNLGNLPSNFFFYQSQRAIWEVLMTYESGNLREEDVSLMGLFSPQSAPWQRPPDWNFCFYVSGPRISKPFGSWPWTPSETESSVPSSLQGIAAGCCLKKQKTKRLFEDKIDVSVMKTTAVMFDWIVFLCLLHVMIN